MFEIMNLDELEQFYSCKLPSELSDRDLLIAIQVSRCVLKRLVDGGAASIAINFWHTYYHICEEQLDIRGIKYRNVEIVCGINILVTDKRAELWSDEKIREDFLARASVETIASMIEILSALTPTTENAAALMQLHALYCSRLN